MLRAQDNILWRFSSVSSWSPFSQIFWLLPMCWLLQCNPWCVTPRQVPNDHSHHPAKSSEHYYLLSGRLGGSRCPGCQPCAQDTYIFTISEGRHLFYPQRSNNQYLWISRATLFTGQYVSSHMSTYLFRPLLPRLKGGKGLGYICYKRWDILSDT